MITPPRRARRNDDTLGIASVGIERILGHRGGIFGSLRQFAQCASKRPIYGRLWRLRHNTARSGRSSRCEARAGSRRPRNSTGGGQPRFGALPLRSSLRRRSDRGPSPRRSTSPFPLREHRSPSFTTPKTCRNPISSGALRRVHGRRRPACLCPGVADDRQHDRQLARAHVHGRLCRPIRCFFAGARGAAFAAAARRLFEPLPHYRLMSGRRLGSRCV